MVVRATSARIEDLHPQGRCLEEGCDWKSPPSTDTNSLAKDHTVATGHRTQSVRARVIEYVRVGMEP